jgi:phosphatidylserine/phosphatidylglycerophosphate/cardiolipin synthase-like enzyme
MHRALIVLPDDTAQPVLQAIAAARRTILAKMFVLTDAEVMAALVEAAKRGVHVRLMLNPARRSGEDDNAESRVTLARGKVEVRDSNPAFELTHEKSMVVDNETALVMSFNWDAKNLTETRDYAVVTSHRHEVDEIVACFEADWHRRKLDLGDGAHLIWCNSNGRDRVAAFIDAARHSLHVQNERYQDEVVIERLVRARTRGVKVHVMARPPHSLKKDKLVEGVGGLRILDDVGIKVHKVHGLKLHAKMMLADGERAIVGSINLAPGSFDHRRELAIEVHDDAVIARLESIVHRDWEGSRPLDLTDAGLLADFEDREDELRSTLGVAPVRK